MLELPTKTNGRKFRLEPRNRFVRHSLIHMIGNLPPLLELNHGSCH
jgi:hypothetical protein